MHKVFGTKENEVYYDRAGAYIIPVEDNKIGLIKTPKGYFLLGGGYETNETDKQCIFRECLEEIGHKVTVYQKVCSAEAYCYHEKIGYFHPIQIYYLGEISNKVKEPTEQNHQFIWIDFENAQNLMYSEMQKWAVKQAIIKYNEQLKIRKPNRLNNYDYSQNGAYFITICTSDRKPILSEIKNTVGATIGRPCIVQLTNIGRIVEKHIKEIEEYYENVFVDKYIIMPNHIHLIFHIKNAGGRPMVVPTVSRIIQQFKGSVSKQIGKSIWQKSFYYHIIRDEYDYQIKWQYIDDNPIKWSEDELYCK